MITRVTFSVAKLLKEKGFDQTIRPTYWTNGELTMTTNGDVRHLYSSAPTIAEVVMWLYEKHTLWVMIYLMERSSDWSIYFDFSIKRKERGLINISTKLEEFDTPTAAYEAAIEYCLTKLI